jgi:CubicO group peptidase (beta-lactamase class C family)
VILLSALIGNPWEICKEYLYKPLGITSGKWTRSGCGVDYPSWGEDFTSDLSARDLLKIGRLMLEKGKGIVSPDFIGASVRPSQASEKYGFLWWLEEDSFHGRGFGGQELNVCPENKTVSVIQATVTPSSKSYGDVFGLEV